MQNPSTFLTWHICAKNQIIFCFNYTGERRFYVSLPILILILSHFSLENNSFNIFTEPNTDATVVSDDF